MGCRHGSDPTLLWLWCRPAATAWIRPLVWEPPYAMGVALEMEKKKKSNTNMCVCVYVCVCFSFLLLRAPAARSYLLSLTSSSSLSFHHCPHLTIQNNFQAYPSITITLTRTQKIYSHQNVPLPLSNACVFFSFLKK